MNSKRLLVDFDNVIHDAKSGWLEGIIYGGLIEGAKEKIELLQKSGFEVIVFTAREDTVTVKEWLYKNGLELEVTNIKLPALAYIDDRAIRFTNWEDIVKYFI